MTTVKDLKELDKIRDEVPEAEISDPFVAAFITEFKLDELEQEITADADEREYLLDQAFNRMTWLEKTRTKVLKEISQHPDLLLLQAKSKALHERLYTTKKGEYGKISQIPPKGVLSTKYNRYNDAIELLKEALYNKNVVPIDNMIENAKAELDMAKALVAAEDREWKAGRKEQS